MASIYQFKAEGIGGEEIDFADFEGKKLLIVNVASECGYTPQYQQLQELYEEFKDKLVVIGFPSNDFGGQEPGTNGEIRAFCTTHFGVNFPMAAKISVTGNQQHPIYQWLTQKDLNGREDSQVAWNFHKYLIDEKGQFVQSYPSRISPLDDVVLNWIQG
ncbi:MAG: glutathione peroxidase [Bacteroidota bacterium]